jgi:DNA-binding LytR/AlgR family response regulator
MMVVSRFETPPADDIGAAFDNNGPVTGAGSDDAVKLRVLAVDDEAPALADLVFELRANPSIGEVVAVADATDALRAVRVGNFDAVFLDVRMPGLDGLELARVLQQFRLAPVVVFVTAYDAHAVDAFEIAAADYLLKPVRRERLNEAMRRVRAAVALRDDRERDRTVTVDAESLVLDSRSDPASSNSVGSVTGMPPAAHGQSTQGIEGLVGGPAAPIPGNAAVSAPVPEVPAVVENEKISVESGGRIRVIARRDVLYVAASGDYVRLFLAESSVLYRSAISALEQRWGAVGFVRIHRGYLVNLRHVDEVRVEPGRGYMVAIGGRTLPVSRRLARSLKQRLLDDLPPE